MIKMEKGWAFPAVDHFMAAEMKPDGSYQASHLAKALEYVTDFSIALDGGSHVGTWARPMSKRFARVIAVEPMQDTFLALTHNMAAFGCTNVELHNVALGHEAGFAHMAIDPKAEALQNTGGRYMLEGGDIPVVTIDSWKLPTLGFLKLDVEGAELHALQGAASTLQRCKPIVLFEDKGFWTRLGLKRNAPQTFLASLGYRHLIRVGCDEIFGWVQ